MDFIDPFLTGGLGLLVAIAILAALAWGGSKATVEITKGRLERDKAEDFGIVLGLTISATIGLLAMSEEGWAALAFFACHAIVIAIAVMQRHPWGAIGVLLFPGLGPIAYALYCLSTRPVSDH